MKTIYLFLISLVIIAFSSCENALDLKPISDLTTANFYQNQEHMEGAVAAMYEGLRNYHTDDKTRMAQAPSDNISLFYLGYDEGPQGITQYKTTTSNFVVLQYWQEAYAAIYRANIVLEKAEEVEYQDADLKARHIAEARFIRGYVYYDMVRFFGGVPIMGKPLPLEEYYGIKRNSADEVWDFARQELEYAAANLTSEVDGSGRVNKWSALGILADYHMNRNLDYASAKAAIDQVINDGEFEWFNDFAEVWKDANNNGKHSIFAVQYLNQTGEGNPMPTQVAPKFISTDMWPFAGQGGEFNFTPSQEFYDTYDSTDLRRDLTLWDWYIDGRDSDTIEEIWQVKHGINNTPYAFRVWGINHIVMRYAEALLISAECENEIGDQNRALEIINQIRTRAGLPDFSSTDKVEIRAEIMLQRRLELAFENERWFDLQRWDKLEPGKMTEIINAFINYGGTPEGINWSDTYRLFPIPILEIKKVGEDILTQNPGY